MFSTKEQVPCLANREDRVNVYTTDYRFVARRFCASLMKDDVAAEHAVDAVFREIEEKNLAWPSERHFKTFLFIRLRDHCLTYLRTADKNQLLGQTGAKKPATRPDLKWMEWPEALKERLLARTI